ncbi:hypothetical protein RJ639_040109 [Escallonia herrerae]|uniref:Uncharacterized protein n=1 Tax=Escallonia herrerae TaxID=1293975 RepID=A0AA89B998_9ASTE|nr:hypothetical protein RJ639_040109 [Escallonia herrerae]
MAMMQWCGAVAKRLTTLTTEQRLAFSSLSSTSSSSTPSPAAPILCGRGDKRTKKGKRFKGSYGNARPKKEKKQERIKDRVEVPRVAISTVLLNHAMASGIFNTVLATYIVEKLDLSIGDYPHFLME